MRKVLFRSLLLTAIVAAVFCFYYALPDVNVLKKKNPKLRRRNPRRLKRKRRKPYRRSKKMQGRLCQPSGLKGSSRKLDPEKKSAKRRA